MILKASQRGGGRELAVHLMRTDDNEHVELHELRGFVSDNLHGAFKEADAISRGTKCRQFLFSLSLSPPEQARVPVEIFELTIDRIERRLGLKGQPRAIVFHEKEGRRHAHCVWSRIDADTMTARPLPFFKNKLMEIARDLYLEHGWKMPPGFENSAERNPTNFSLAEWQQAKRQGVDPRWLKQVVQQCWSASDNRNSFARSLEDRGFSLARGDKRGFVVVDHTGEVYSLPRMLDLKTKEVRARLGDGENLDSVAAAQKRIGERIAPMIHAHISEAREQFRAHSAKLGDEKALMTRRHRDARNELDTRHAAEALGEIRQRAARLPKGLHALWHRITGRYQQLRRELEFEAEEIQRRRAQHRQALIDEQIDQRRALQVRFKELRHRQAVRLFDLRADSGLYRRLARGEGVSPSRARSAPLEHEP